MLRLSRPVLAAVRCAAPSLAARSAARVAPLAAAAALKPAAAAASSRRFTSASSLAADATPAAAAPSSSVDGARLFSGSAAFSHLRLDFDPALRVLRVTMQRPDLHNAFNEHVIREIKQCFELVRAADAASELGSLRAVVLTGAGASFSAGADLNWMKQMRAYTEAENMADSKQLFQMFLAIARCPCPVIARVNGAALGGGVGLVAACDVAVAYKDAKFGLTEVKLGLSPAVISSFVMAKLTPAAANFFFLTGSRFSAAEAQANGLVNQVVETEAELDAAVQRIVEEIAQNSPKAVRATKQLLAQIRSEPRIEQSEEYCTALIAKLRVSSEGQEGLNSFFEKRKAAWIPGHLGNPKPKSKK